MKRLSVRAALLAAVLLALPTTGPVEAGIDVDLGVRAEIGDADLFLNISSRYFDRDRPAIERVAVRYNNPDDLAVSLFICRHSRQTPEAVYKLRRQGLSWWEISARFGVPADVWFVEVRRDPGPPYGKAYGHWKKHKRDKSQVVVLTDADVRNLMAVRMIHEYYGVSVEVAMDWRSSGRNLQGILSDEYRKRHGKPDKAAKSHGNKGKGNGKKK
jgi:hypothetical protein